MIQGGQDSLFLSVRKEFLERVEFIFFRSWPLKKTCQHIFHQITPSSWSSHLNRHPDRAAAFSTYLVNNDQEHTWCLTCKNQYVCINTFETSFDESPLGNINIFWRNLAQFTGLLCTNAAVAKRCLLTERTGLGKSESVALRKNGPKVQTAQRRINKTKNKKAKKKK